MVLLVAVPLLSSLAGGETPAQAPATPRQIFEDRIMPIFNSPNPSSCVQCHLSEVDLKNYILPSHEKTFRSLRDKGLIDLDKPAESKILGLIRRGAVDENEGAALIHAKLRKAEYEAFAAWIKSCCDDPRLRNAPRLEAAEADQERLEFIAAVEQVAQTDKVLATFTSTVWAERNRCNDCHMPGGKNNPKFVAKYGQKMNWIQRDAASTMKYLAANKLIDPKQPEKSLLLQKPLAIDVEHGGGQKIKKGDPCYNAYLAFLKVYAESGDAPVAVKPKTEDKKPPAPAVERKSIELAFEGVKDVNDSIKIRAALSAVPGVKMVVIDRKSSGPSPVRVDYEDKEPDLKALIEAAGKAGYKASKTGS
jgi:mono/diheme cytochrome c family protein/copper chaperone CopZ